MPKQTKDLVAIIKANPGCTAVIDNDSWELIKKKPVAFDSWDGEKQDEWLEKATLVNSHDTIKPLGDGGYGSGNCYGGDILCALAAIVGINIESV